MFVDTELKRGLRVVSHQSATSRNQQFRHQLREIQKLNQSIRSLLQKQIEDVRVSCIVTSATCILHSTWKNICACIKIKNLKAPH